MPFSLPSDPSDETLTRDGLVPRDEKGQVLVLACGALANEILAIIRANNLDHLTLTCLPAILHNSPDKIPAAVEEALDKHQNNYESVFLAYADCGTGGKLAEICASRGIEMIRGPHCYSFFEGNSAFEARAEGEIDVFYLTDFLARGFESFVVKPLGLDRHPELRDMYFGHYTRLVYLAQTDNPELDEKARAAAQMLGLAYSRQLTGYGDLETAVLQAK
ncbi:DUF1638 domain-containing protein [Aliiroseovarius crassostreae]|uniref:DUF1638 domain-containing protein n=1 Tax=Aliiroseovarius crassostreae TaxID=154981 RepID=UPI00220B7023|nr:DUF1638 domain-containing protein [Aliiroseovarius crassostreae]UWP90209.1 DUF1638 domain-containing protein [Aliiroseovarius crassostreae]